MKRRALIAWVIIFLVGIVVIAAQQLRSAASSKSESTSAPQWEYLVVAGGTTNLSSSSESLSSARKQPDNSFNREATGLERNLDKLGARGWELVSVSGNSNDPVFYFKRLK